MEIIKVIAVIIIGLLMLKFIWGMAKGIIKLVLGIIIITVGIYLIKPEILYNTFGMNSVENAASKIKEQGNDLVNKGVKELDTLKDNVTK